MDDKLSLKDDICELFKQFDTDIKDEGLKSVSNEEICNHISFDIIDGCTICTVCGIELNSLKLKNNLMQDYNEDKYLLRSCL